jgi:hypothetical protein
MPRTVREWERVFELLHRLWGSQVAGDPYDAATKRRWCELLELLEDHAAAAGYYEATSH